MAASSLWQLIKAEIFPSGITNTKCDWQDLTEKLKFVLEKSGYG
jgi:hypothetical protein